MITHADPPRRILTAVAVACFREEGCPPACGVCRRDLVAGDWVDLHYPRAHAGNVCRACAAAATEPAA